MESAPTSFRTSLINPRHRPRPRNIQPRNGQKERHTEQATMTKDHRFYHRRQVQPTTQIVTVNVEIIATVDSSGNVIGRETKTQADPTIPTPGAVVSAAPIAAPVVNAANPVPAPIASVVRNAGNPAVAPAASAPGVAAINALQPAELTVPVVPVPAIPSLPQVPAVPPMPTDALPVVPSVPPFPSHNSPISSVASRVPTPVSNSTNIVSGLSTLDSISLSLSITSSGRFSSDSDETSSRHTSTTISPAEASRTNLGGVGPGGPANTAVATANPAAAGNGVAGNSSPLETPQVVGSVVGSLAGAALILAVILFLLRRHKKRRQGALQLTNEEATDRAQPMAQRASWGNRIPSTFLNRFSGMSRSTAETSTSGGERGFQRVSGRKLPSAFSEGMTSEQFSRGGTMSGQSFYQDDQGTYGGAGLSKELGKEVGMSAGAAGAGMMNIRPSPARTPVIRHPDEEVNPFADPGPFPKARAHLSPPQSPNPDVPCGTLGRSLHSHDGSRSSKFTENV
ncbi:hypothetical protein GQ44DRAFT_56329 [Phaeosphaeriaceae sp. PMI808]|nr:hypothetical protein GQ44DRAFT_56329 [Phaeosphaeriaceae sp. PMI808]